MTLADEKPATLKATISDALATLGDPVGGIGIHLLAAVPGGGKTRATQEVIAERIARGETLWVLFVVRETLGDDSLAAETVKRFIDLGVPAEIVKGRKHFSGRDKQKRYAAQFKWGTGSQVKAISHRHLTSMLCSEEGGLLRTCLEEASLVVVDEDPLQSLVLPGEGWSLERLAQLTAPGRITEALLTLAESGDWREKATEKITIRQVVTHRWTNTKFWEALQAELGSLDQSDLDDFTRDLLKVSRSSAEDDIEGTLSGGAIKAVVAAFREDYEDERRCSQRFHLKRTNERTVTFNASVLAPWDERIEVIVLDAYGDLGQYEKVFGNAPVTKIQPREETRLQIQSAPLMRLNDDNITSGHQEQHLLAVLGEVRKHQEARGKPVLILVSKKVRESPYFRQALRKVFADTPETTDSDIEKRVRVQHWQAGRGSNKYFGHDIFALTELHISADAREEMLAALAPCDPAERQRLYNHLQSAEQRQMLNRGRQPQIEEDPPTITVVWEDPGATPYSYRTPFCPQTHQKLWIALVHELVQESVQMMGAFCFDLLLGSPLLKGGQPDPKLAPQFTEWLTGLPQESKLRRVLLDRVLPGDVHPVSRETALKYLNEIAEHSGGALFDVPAGPYRLGGAPKRKVYLANPSSPPDTAVWMFEYFVPEATRTLVRDLDLLI